MGEVKLYFKMVETGQYVPGGADGYIVQTDQTIEDLKIGVESYYNIPKFDSSWLLKLSSDSGVVLDNPKTIKDSGLKDNDVLFIQDPDMVRISYVDNGATKSVWAHQSDTIKTLKERVIAAQAKDYDFVLQVQRRKLEGSSTVHSLFDNISLNLETTLKTPRTILTGLLEGNYRIFNNKLNAYLYINSLNLVVSTTTSASSATHFKVELNSNDVTTAPTVVISYLDTTGIRRYVSYTPYGSEPIVVLSTSRDKWTARAKNSSQYQRYSLDWDPQSLLTIQDGKVKLIYDPGNNYQDWSFVV